MDISELDPLRDRLNRPLHDLRISVMDRCNFRCPYCMPEDQYHPKFQFMTQQERLSFEEIMRLTGLFAGLGVRKLRITGGEPLLRSQLSELVGELSQVTGIEDIALTTNGVLLRQQAAALKAAGLHRVTVSLDSLDDEIFTRLTGGRGGKERVLEGIEAALEAGLGPVKVNIVLQKGINEDGVFDLLEYFRNTGVVLRFIEYMDVGTINHWSPSDIVSSAELVDRIGRRWPLEPLDRNYHGEVASRYKYKDGAGEIGFISSVTEPFCRDCTRARLSSDGKLFLCLFAENGLNLRGPMREGATDGDLLALISAAWRKRTDRYSEQRADRRDGKSETRRVEMYYIGG
jgi:cyclic pyranopterin phosphate synthase